MHSQFHTSMPYSGRESTLMSSETFLPAGARNQTEVFAVHGADPEVLAYAMAKYSRSALSMRESLAEISAHILDTGQEIRTNEPRAVVDVERLLFGSRDAETEG